MCMYTCITCTCIHVDPLRMSLTVETKAWKSAYGRSMNELYRSSMDHIVQFVSDYSKKLIRPIKVLYYTVYYISLYYIVYCIMCVIGFGGC